MARSPPVENLLETECGVNYQLLAVITEVAQWWTPSFSPPQPATDNGVRDGRSNWLVAPPPSWAAPPELYVLHGVNAAYKSQDLLHQPGLERASTGMPDQRTTCAATQGICTFSFSAPLHSEIYSFVTLITSQTLHLKNINFSSLSTFHTQCHCPIQRRFYYNYYH